MTFLPLLQPALTLPAGMRATRAVQALLSVLPVQPEGGWTQALVEAALQQQGVHVNRVTVYRALDRLMEAGLLQRTIDSQRITRYWVVHAEANPFLAHMECKGCHQPLALDTGAAAVQVALQALRQAVTQAMGVANATLDVTVHTQCASCADNAAQHVSSTT